MSRQNTLYQLTNWVSTVTENMGNLNKSQAKILGQVSFAMALVRSCGQTMVSATLAEILKKDEEAMRQQVRELYYHKNNKRGKKRATMEIETCFSPLLRWILSVWQDNKLALALDATTLTDRFIVLSVNVLYRGNAIPVAWKVLKSNRKHRWNPEWLRLLSLIKPAISEHMNVLVLTDQGLYSKTLFHAIKDFGWHPFMRIRPDGTFRPETHHSFCPLVWFAPTSGTYWAGSGIAFSSNPVPCTLLAYWEHGYDGPWIIITDLPHSDAQACYYSLRFWIEPSFRFLKRSFFQWHHTKMTEPARVERFLLPIAIATFFLSSLGTQYDQNVIQNSPPLVFQSLDNFSVVKPPPRRLSVIKRGAISMLVSLLEDGMVLLGNLLPTPYPFLLPNR